MNNSFVDQLEEHIHVMGLMRDLESQINKVGQQWIDSLENGGKVLLMGNGLPLDSPIRNSLCISQV